MIAQFRALLPESIRLIPGEILLPYEMEFRGHKIRVFPPMKADRSKSINLVEGAPSGDITISGSPTIDANMIQLEVTADTFDRIEGRELECLKSQLDLFFAALNETIVKIRVVTRSHFLKPLSEPYTDWVIRYFNDDGTKLQKQPGLFNGQYKQHEEIRAVILQAESWRHVQTINLRTWENLILDARDSLPESGPAIVLASTALETFISYALDVLQKESGGSFSAAAWEWLNTRKDRKNPSTNEQFTGLLKLFTGKSLSDEVNLWKSFLELSEARNKFVHEGQATLKGTFVDVNQAATLVSKAEEILTWGESLLPEKNRRVSSSRPELTLTIPLR